MSAQNVEVMRRMYDAWLSGDTHTAFEAFDPEIELHPAPESDWVGLENIYHGHNGFNRYMRSIYDAFDDYRAKIEELIDAGDKVVTLAIEQARGKASGANVEIRHTAHVWTMRNGKAVRLDLYWDRERALKAASLATR